MPALTYGRLRRPGRPTALMVVLPVLVGALVAGASALLLGYFTPIWTALVLVGGSVVVGSRLVKNSQTYWLALFLLAVPLNIHKKFAASEVLLAQVETLGLPWGATTAFLQLSDLPLAVLLASWLLIKLARREPLYWPRVNYLPLAFLAWCTLGLMFSPSPSFTLFEIVRQTKFFLIYLFVINNVSPRKLGRLIILMLLLGLLLQEGVTLVRYYFQLGDTFFGTTFGDESNRVVQRGSVTLGPTDDKERGEGTFGHPNQTAMHFDFVLPLALILSLASRHPEQRWLGLFTFLLGLPALAATFSRGGMIGVLTGAAVCLALAWMRRLASRPLVLGVAALALVLSPFALYGLSSYLTTRPEMFEQRFVHWRVGAAMIALNPVFGIGLNTSTAVRQNLPFALPGEELIEEEYPIHNHYLIGIIETGLVGALLYLSFFVLIGLAAFRCCRSKDAVAATMAIGILAAYAAIAVHMTIDFLAMDALHTLLWLYAGLVVALNVEEAARAPASTAPREESIGRRHSGILPVSVGSQNPLWD